MKRVISRRFGRSKTESLSPWKWMGKSLSGPHSITWLMQKLYYHGLSTTCFRLQWSALHHFTQRIIWCFSCSYRGGTQGELCEGWMRDQSVCDRNHLGLNWQITTLSSQHHKKQRYDKYWDTKDSKHTEKSNSKQISHTKKFFFPNQAQKQPNKSIFWLSQTKS